MNSQRHHPGHRSILYIHYILLTPHNHLCHHSRARSVNWCSGSPVLRDPSNWYVFSCRCLLALQLRTWAVHPPAFCNITYKIFIVFGVLYFTAALQYYFTYPETCGRTLDEIKIMSSSGGVKLGTPSLVDWDWKRKLKQSLIKTRKEMICMSMLQ